MQKIVIDTNVFVSALIQRNYPYYILNDLVLDNKITLCVSEELLAEYFEVLARPKFSKFQDFFARAESLLVYIENKAMVFQPKIKLNIISDFDDNKIIELADECNADFIITGNTNDFTFSSYKNTKILTPKDYWENHKPNHY
jgi:putative PIN family toxin of toxin-antitoxin system